MPSIDANDNTDEQLITKVARGDEKAFEQLVHRYQQAVFSTIYRYIGKSEDVQDLAQEIFIKVWRSAAKFKHRSKFSTWLYRITANHCINYRRKNLPQHASLDEMAEQGQTPQALIVEPDWKQKRETELVHKAVTELPKRQRMALILAQFEGRSYKEIAEIMRVSVSSVESLLFRARSSLRDKLVKVL